MLNCRVAFQRARPPCEHVGVDCTLSSWADFPGGLRGSESPRQAKRNALVLASIEARRSTQFTSKGEKSLQPLSLRPLNPLSRAPKNPLSPPPPPAPPASPSTLNLSDPIAKTFFAFLPICRCRASNPLSSSLSWFVLSSSHFAPENG